MGRNNVKS